MYKCNCCGEIFEKPETVTETHGLDTPPYETWLACPRCGDYDFAQAIYRDGDYYTEEKLRQMEDEEDEIY